MLLSYRKTCRREYHLAPNQRDANREFIEDQYQSSPTTRGCRAIFLEDSSWHLPFAVDRCAWTTTRKYSSNACARNREIIGLVYNEQQQLVCLWANRYRMMKSHQCMGFILIATLTHLREMLLEWRSIDTYSP